MSEYTSYIARFAKPADPLIREIEQYAAEHRVPIMDESGINTLIGLLQIQQPQRILEIGSAIGYSAIRMAAAFPNASIATIERDEERYELAVQYIRQSGMADRIELIKGDALELDMSRFRERNFDALFIDAAKGQYQKFFEKYSSLLKPNGVVYCDNMFMHGMVLLDDPDIPRSKRTMIRNLKSFTEWAMQHEQFETALLPVGDGILIAVKK